MKKVFKYIILLLLFSVTICASDSTAGTLPIQDDQPLWIAIFILSTLTILGFLFYLNQFKKFKNIQIKMQEKQDELELIIKNINREDQEVETSTLPVKQELTNINIVKNKLVDDTRMMLYFMRLKSNKIKIIREKFNSNIMLSNILGTLSNNFKESKTELIFDIEHNVPKMLFGDPLHLSEVLLELLQNAMKYTIDGEVKLHISVSGSSGENQKLRFKVIDTGIGIKEDQIDSLFIPTYAEDGDYKGVGLYVSSELISMMNGELTVRDSSDMGTTFECIIPLIDDGIFDKRKYRLPHKSYVGKKVLIFDDNQNAARAIEKMFTYFRCEVQIVPSEKLRLKSIYLSEFDIILGDVEHLDPKNIKQIKNAREKCDLKVVNISSVFSAKKFSPSDYIDEWLIKPLSQERLFELIISLFDHESQRDHADSSRYSDTKELKVVYPQDVTVAKSVTADSFKAFKNSHILIVDDSFIDQKLLQSILGKGEIDVTTASNGEEAIEKLKMGWIHYDLILMDINMPIMDGYDTISEIRKNRHYSQIPIVVLTSLMLESDIDKMFQSGANAYIGKPLHIDFLYSVLALFLTKEIVSPKEDTPKKRIYPKIDGLNVEKGIKSANDNEELYREILSEFVLAYGDSDETLGRMVEDDRHQHVKRLCLDMKRLTDMIGAYDMFDIVDSMHKQYYYNNAHLIPKFVETYHDGLKRLLTAIEEYRA